jgi:trk system potassium uptake protein TrkH
MEKTKQISSLSTPVRIRVIAKYLGYLCIVLSGLPAVSLVTSLFFKEYSLSLSYSIGCLLLLIIGSLFARLNAPQDIKRHEALVITALAFIFSSVAASFPFTVAGMSVMDAWFEAVSAVTTTGLSTLPSVETMPRTFLFTRSLLQWVGGLGIVIFYIALLVRPGQVARRLMDFDEPDNILEGTRSYARRVMTVYILLTVTGFVLLYLQGVQWYPSLLHTLSAVSTGGFSMYDRNLAGLGTWSVQMTAMLIAFSGGLPIILYFRSYNRGVRYFFNDIQVRALFVAVVIFSVLITLALKSGGMSWNHSLHHAPLMAITAQTGTGFSTMNISEMNMLAKGLLIVSMTIGAAAGSTTGGIKIFRLLVFLKIVLIVVRKTLLPRHAVVSPHLNGHRIDDDEINAVLLVILLFIVIIMLSWLAFIAGGYDPMDSLFDVLSATCTVGLSTGVVSSSLPASLKAVLCVDMLFGRVEIIAMLVLLYPGTWFGKKGA